MAVLFLAKVSAHPPGVFFTSLDAATSRVRHVSLPLSLSLSRSVITQVDKHDKNKDSKLDDAEMLALLKEATGSDNIAQEDVKRVRVCLLPPSL